MIQGARADDYPTQPDEAAEPSAREADIWASAGGAPARVAPRRWPPIVGGVALAVAAIGWMVLLGVTLVSVAPALSALRLLAWIGLGSGPLALLAALALLLRRGERLRTREYREAAAGLRADAAALGEVLARVSREVGSARSELAAHATELAGIGTDASERLTRAARQLATQAEEVGRTATGLDDATATARADLGVLLSDLPRAEAASEALAERLRQGGAEAETRARTLVELLAGLDEGARAASESTGGAAARLAAQLERVESGVAHAERRIGDSAVAMDRTVEQALAAAASGVDDTRRAISDQATALAAMVDQGRSAFDAAGADAARALAGRLESLHARLDALGAGLAAQDGAARDWLGAVERSLTVAEARLQGIAAAGDARAGELAGTLSTVHEQAGAVTATLAAQERAASVMLDRVSQLRAQAEAGGVALGETIPAALARVRIQAEQSLQAIATAGERGERLHDTADAVATRLAEAGAELERQQRMLEELGGQASDRLTQATDTTTALRTLVSRTDAEVRELSEAAANGLVEALLRVREVATRAGEEARDALSAAIPRAAQRLGESASRALVAALNDAGQEQLGQVSATASQAVDAARVAAERLAQQLLLVAETATAIDARIAANRADTEAHDEASFARSAGLLIEALNSTAIDLTRLFASEVSEEAWRTYLRGDRGVFTRRAIRLLDRSEASAVAARYEAETEFQEQVNRYVHDFEALVRRVMAMGEGSGLATTLLSSDMGKLYVALAQAIDRFRR